MKRLAKELYYRCYCMINYIIPKKKTRIFFYDSKLLRQNCWALFLYMVNNSYNTKYELYYFSKSDSALDKYKNLNNVKFISNPLVGAFMHWRSKYTFFEYDNFKFISTDARGQLNFNIWHGMPLKRIGYMASEKPAHQYSRDFTYILSTSPFFTPIMKESFGCDDKKIYTGGYPRNDQLFENKRLSKLYKKNRTNVLWMPTFRKSTMNAFRDSDIEFPILQKSTIDGLNNTLAELNINLVIKLHPFQDNIDWLRNANCSNIQLITNEDIFADELELYEFIGQSDILLTDYSSVYVDYLLLNKPIIFIVDDYEEYRRNRGFNFENLYEIMPGHIVSDLNQFISALTELVSGTDSYYSQRIEVCNLLNTEKSDFSKHLLDYLDICVR